MLKSEKKIGKEMDRATKFCERKTGSVEKKKKKKKNKSSKDRTWSAVPDALLGVIS